MSSRILLTMAGLSLLINACGPLKDMREMKKTTNELLVVSQDMNKKMDNMEKATNKMEGATQRMNKSTDDMLEVTKTLAEIMKEMNQKLTATDQKMEIMVKGLSAMKDLTAQMSEQLKSMAGDTRTLISISRDLATKIDQTNAKMQTMLGDLAEMKRVTGLMYKTTGDLAEHSKQMKEKLIETDEKMQTMLTHLKNMYDLTDALLDNMLDMGEQTNNIRAISDDMRDKITETITQMGDMLKEIRKMGNTTKNMGEDLRDTVVSIRPGLAMDHVEKAREDMDKTETLEAKAAYGKVYFSSAEFHLWTNKGHDDHARREEMFRVALAKLFADVKANMVKDAANHFPPRGFISDKEENKIANLYAFAMTMHTTNYNQNTFIQKKELGVKSVLDLIQEGMAYKVVEKKTPEYIKEIKKNMDLVTMLLQMRYTGLALTTMKKLTDKFEEPSVGASLVNVLPGGSHVAGALPPAASREQWTVDYSRLQSTENLSYMTSVVSLGLESRKILLQNKMQLADPTAGAGYVKFSNIVRFMVVPEPQGLEEAMKLEASKLQQQLLELKAHYKN